MNRVSNPPAQPANKMLRVIAALKFVEAAAVAVGGVAALKLLDSSTLDRLAKWSQAVPGVGDQAIAQRMLDHLGDISQHQLIALGAGAFVFASIFLAEGVGLWLERRWAEWLSVVATGLFIPIEIAEIFQKTSATRIIALVLNAFVVIYMIVRLLASKDGQKRSHAS